MKNFLILIKRTVSFAVYSIIIIVLFTSCKNEKPISTLEVVASDGSTFANENHIEDLPDNSGFLYINKDLGFSVKFPETLRDKIEIVPVTRTDHDDYDGSGIVVYHKTTKEEYPKIGTLFQIERWICKQSEENPPIMAGTSTIVLQTNEYTYMLRTNSGVEYNEEPGSETGE